MTTKRHPGRGGEPGAAPHSRPAADAVAPALALLIVDPDPTVGGLLRSRFASGPFSAEIETAATLREGLTRLAERPFGLVIVALATADADGVASLERIRAIDAEVPIVMTSDGDDDAAAAIQAIQCGAQDCVPRSEFEGRSALRILRHAIERQRIMLELQEARQHEQYLATHDPLSGIPNRALFYDRLAQAIAAASRYGTTLAVLFLDLDGFKAINDTLGHTAGDRLLQEIARRITSLVRKSDTAARIGGDEFCVILSQVARASDAVTVAENMLRRIREPLTLGGGERCVAASIGIAVYPGDGELADTLVRNADTAMYHAKQQGGDRYAFFQRRMRAED